MSRYAKIAAVLFALYVAITLWAHADAQSAPCAEAGFTSEGFPVVECPDGTRWYQDLDGQPYPNAAGNPVYCPGVWVRMEG